MKIAILCHSVTKNTFTIGECIAEGIKKAGCEVRIMQIDDIDEDYVKEAKVVLFGTPTYYASMSWQMKKWFDTSKIKLAGKLGACFATANFMGGGSEIAMSDLVHHMLVKGMLVYSGGAGNGQPFTHLGAASVKDGDDFQKERAVIFGERMAKKALEIF